MATYDAEPIGEDGGEGDARPARDDDKILEEARKRYEHALSVDGDNRKNADFATAFVWKKGAQWPENVRNEREGGDLPCLEINQLPQFLKQVVNDFRLTRPGIKCAPASGDASEQTAKVLQELTRGIEYQSNAESCYDSAIECAATGGRGYVRLVTEYDEGENFEQVIRIRRIPDPNAVLFDPDYQHADASDIRWCFVTELVPKEEFERRWPDAPQVNFNAEGCGQWFQGDGIIVADYFVKKVIPRVRVAMRDGTIGWKDELFEATGGKLPEGVEIVRERTVDDHKICWYKIGGGQHLLEEPEWPGAYIPVFMCVGDETIVEGKRIFKGLIDRAIDPQRSYNYAVSKIAEILALVPKNPYIAAEGQIEGHETEWANANKIAKSVLYYNPVMEGGHLVPPPQRQPFAGVPTGLVEQAAQAKADLQATIGMYDPALGKRSNETSGVAIGRREQQADVATFHFPDNVSRMIGLLGRAIIDLAPAIYDTPRLVLGIDDEDKQQLLSINEQMPNPDNPIEAIQRNDISRGKYAVTVEAAPSFATRRQETASSVIEFVQAFPPAAPILAPIAAKVMDWPGADRIAKVLRSMLPPPAQQALAEEGEQQPQIPPQVQAQMQQMQQQLQALTQENQALKAGAQSDIEQAQIKANAQVKVAEINAIAKLRAQKLECEMQPDIPGANIPGAPANDFEAQLAQVVGQPPRAPQDQSGVLAQLVQALQAMAQAAAAPRHLMPIKDSAGNITGAVSQPSQSIQ
jgi:portal protein